MVRDKQKFALWLTPETKQKIEGHYRGDNCKSQSEFIEKAVKFYCGYLDTEGADDYLPRVLSAILESKLDGLGSRLNKQQFKMAVNVNLMATILAMGLQISPDNVKKIKVQCIRETKETNGQLSFEDAVEKYRRDA